MFTCDGRSFATVAIARLVIVDGWTHVPGAAVDGDGRHPGGCTWMVERGYWIDADDDWAPEYVERVEDCGAELAYNDDRWVCAAGHEHTSAEAREREGWDYADSPEEARRLASVGVDSRPMGPNTFL
jgi:hypothetical protein